MSIQDSLLERNLIPEQLLRVVIRSKLRQKVQIEFNIYKQNPQRLEEIVDELRRSPIAITTEEANEQHYEVPPLFFKTVLGHHLKYSCGLWPEGATSLDNSERHMLALYCDRAKLRDGQNILDLGCGWGSLSLFLAQKYPNSKITGVSNSRSQKQFIEQRAKELNITNLKIFTADMNHFQPVETYDRILSIEMFEHMRNYDQLLRKISGWLNPDGFLFVHIFVHHQYTYFFNHMDPGNWMAKHFFTGGIMPSQNLLSYFQKDLALIDHWQVSGVHYQKTCEAWLKRMKENKPEIIALFNQTYGREQSLKWWVYWKIFFISCAELFGFNSGKEWLVCHYLFKKN